MKTIGLIGGTSWESSLEYYRMLNQYANQLLGKKHSARILMYSFDWMEFEVLIQKDDFTTIGNRIVEEAVKLEKAGAELLMLGANSTHYWADQVMENTRSPLIHIADATGEEILRSGIKRVLLLGTKYTMEWDFIKKKLTEEYALKVLVPEKSEREEIHRIIYNELIIGNFNEKARNYIIKLIINTKQIDGVILGCTELPILLRQTDFDRPMFNTTSIHAKKAVESAMKS